MMKGKSVKILAAILATTMLCTTSVLADTHVQYHFNLSATGQNFNKDTASLNKKTIQGDPWTFKPYHLETGASPYGMLFVPYHKPTGIFCTSAQLWRKTGQYDLKYTPFGVGNIGEYYLAARTDDTAAGKYASDGWWNSDKVY